MDKFRDVVEGLCELHEIKDERYGNAFGQVRKRYPCTIAVMLRFKLNRLENLLDDPSLENEESVEDTLKDIANYAIMELTERGN